MNVQTDRPLIVQNDFHILLENGHADADQARAQLIRFAELEKSAGYIHTYRMSPLSLWNAASSGMKSEQIVHILSLFGKYETPVHVKAEIERYLGRYGLLKLTAGASTNLHLVTQHPEVLNEVLAYSSIHSLTLRRIGEDTVEVPPEHRGIIKQELIKLGYPIEDLVGYQSGEQISIRLRDTASGPFKLRDYQLAAVDAFYKNGTTDGGSGVLVLPCGAGKTVIGIAAMARLGCATLVLTANTTSVSQWKREMLDKTHLSEDVIGQYAGTKRQVRPITIATYQILTYRKNKEEPFRHLSLFHERSWGLIIYDEVHLLPAPVFRATAEIQAARRLGLTATLVREDGRETDVFSLVGPKRFDVSWKSMEDTGWLAKAACTEIRVQMKDKLKREYETASARHRFRIAGENPEKLHIVKHLLNRHRGTPALIIGQYVSQLKKIASELNAALICGETPHSTRDRYYNQFRKGDIKSLPAMSSL